MKSEFILAFNEICESRGLPKEDVFEALKTALVSAYRRDANISASQKVTVDIDPRTGEPTIYSEKEVVDSIIDNRTEVLIDVAKRAGYTDADFGDLVMIDSTTAAFGRIAAQTAKQVLLQRVREAERDQLFEDFSGREGELVNGTVQSVSGQHITIGLGRTEAILPKSQQVSGERYRAHDKIRVYVLEVRRTNRGPQIFVSRNHRNLLRRLLELEVPEIYNGQVDIKSIAREAGQRSKVAVQALQPGVDPVGACVGMRGVRIQSIVRELNDEKIDVIEWDPDQTTFIAKALSPARVSHVFLEESLIDGKTAVVVVPDDQLSLAIGREGQNARLAAKLTGWRIDIKSLTEAARESMDNLTHPAVDPAIVANTKVLEQVTQVLAKKEANRPITSEDYRVLDFLVGNVEGKIIAERVAEFEKARAIQQEARRAVPEAEWSVPLDDLDLPGRLHNLLLDNEVETVGDVLFNLALGDDVILAFRGFGDAALETLKSHLADYQAQQPAAPVELEGEDAETAVPATEAAEVEVEAVVDAEAEIEEPEPETPEAAEEVEVEVEIEEEVVAEVEAAVEEPTAEEAVEEVEPAVAEQEPAAVAEPEPPQQEELIPAIDDLSKPLVTPAEKPKPVSKKKKKPSVVIVRSTEDEKEKEDEKAKGKRGKQLVFDEDAGQVVVKRKRKSSRRRPEWEEFDLEEFDDEF